MLVRLHCSVVSLCLTDQYHTGDCILNQNQHSFNSLNTRLNKYFSMVQLSFSVLCFTVCLLESLCHKL